MTPSTTSYLRGRGLSDWQPTIWERASEVATGEMLPVQIVRTRGMEYPGDRFKAVCRGRCLNRNLEWEWEPIPSSRSKQFLGRCRFTTLEEVQEAVGNATSVGLVVVTEPIRSIEDMRLIMESLVMTMRESARLLAGDCDPDIGTPQFEALQKLRAAIFYSP